MLPGVTGSIVPSRALTTAASRWTRSVQGIAYGAVRDTELVALCRQVKTVEQRCLRL